MANWRQIQGRIRRARTSADPLGKLTELFEKTRDAMVAFEAGSFAEKAGRGEEAIRWYTKAAERFHRAEWRTKASDALARLGAPASEPKSDAPAAPSEWQGTFADEGPAGPAESGPPVSAESVSSFELAAASEIGPSENLPAARADSTASAAALPEGHRRRRRGRRGGRRHKRRSAAAPGARAAQASRVTPGAPIEAARAGESALEDTSKATHVVLEPVEPRPEAEAPTPFPERVTYIRAGEPALASRFAHLESLLRRLVSAPLHRMEEIAEAPAGPGVFLLSDSDLMTNYYVEACQTLRVGAGQLTRTGRHARGESKKTSLRAQLAEHLEISEAKVGDYLRKHCVIRWLQLDDEAPFLAHFAIAVLRPTLNAD